MADRSSFPCVRKSPALARLACHELGDLRMRRAHPELNQNETYLGGFDAGRKLILSISAMNGDLKNGKSHTTKTRYGLDLRGSGAGLQGGQNLAALRLPVCTGWFNRAHHWAPGRRWTELGVPLLAN
jgi:hypothetical protein